MLPARVPISHSFVYIVWATWPDLILPLYTQVRDSWSPLHDPTAAPRPLTSALINHAPDTWDDADMEPVIVWLETYLNERRGKAHRADISWYPNGHLKPRACGHQFKEHPIFVNVVVVERKLCCNDSSLKNKFDEYTNLQPWWLIILAYHLTGYPCYLMHIIFLQLPEKMLLLVRKIASDTIRYNPGNTNGKWCASDSVG